MFYVKEKRYAPERQEANTNFTEVKKCGNNEKEECHKKLGISIKMDINVVHRYSHLGENLLCITFNALEVNLKGMIQVCDV